MDIQKLKNEINALLDAAEQTNEWGGVESDEGCLMPGDVDWLQLKTDINKVIEQSHIPNDLEKLAEALDFYMSWAETWHHQAGGYMASDTLLGVMRMERWAERLREITGKPEKSLRRSMREENTQTMP